MALKQMEVPESPKLYTKKYQGLLGVDYSCDVTEVDQRRTPTGTNMISDEGANPVKRIGWRVINNLPTGSGKVLKMAVMETEDAQCVLFFITEHNFYRAFVTKKSEDATTPTAYFESEVDVEGGEFVYFGNDLYVFLTFTQNDKKQGMYMMASMDTEEAPLVDVAEPYIPEATINITPNGTGGVSLEAINLMTPARTFSFQGDETSTNYWLYPKTVRTNPKYRRMLLQKDDSPVDLKVEVLTQENGWQELTYPDEYTVDYIETNKQFYDEEKDVVTGTICRTKIIFTQPHPADLTTGEDNIRVTFKPVVTSKTIDPENTIYDGFYTEARQDIRQAKHAEVYGHTTTDRIFVSAGVNKNRIYYSAVNNPTYFPDNNWINVGYEANDIQGLVRVSDYLGAIKSDSIYDNTLYLIRGSFLDENMVFTVVPTSAKLGSIAPNSLKTLVDEPIFLTRSGAYGIANVYYSTEKTIKNRSRFLDRKLMKEGNLENACATVWNKYYLLCVNDHCYILDGRKQGYDTTGNTDYQYEAYYWENIPATAFATYNDELYFGTADGRICKFNTDVNDRTKYCDNGIEVWTEVGGEEHLSLTDKNELDEVVASAIPCEWSTLLDDDGAPHYFKTLNKKGNLVTLLPQTKTSADVVLVKDGIQWKSLDRFYANIFDWSELNFAEFPFSSNITARDDFVRKKIKKYKRLQIIIKNSGMFEPFGLLGITKTYYFGNLAK